MVGVPLAGTLMMGIPTIRVRRAPRGYTNEGRSGGRG